MPRRRGGLPVVGGRLDRSRARPGVGGVQEAHRPEDELGGGAAVDRVRREPGDLGAEAGGVTPRERGGDRLLQYLLGGGLDAVPAAEVLAEDEGAGAHQVEAVDRREPGAGRGRGEVRPGDVEDR